MTPTPREWRVHTEDHGWVRVLGWPRHQIMAVVGCFRDGLSLTRAADASVSDVIDRAERMGQKAELN